MEIGVAGKPQVSAADTSFRAFGWSACRPRVSPFVRAALAPSDTMAGVTGKRAGARRGAPTPRRLNRAALAVCAGITLCVVAWGYLVYAAIDFGTAARTGSSSSWLFMGLASLGAVACLFIGLMLIARLVRELGISSSSDDDSPSAPAGPRPQGGKRAAS